MRYKFIISLFQVVLMRKKQELGVQSNSWKRGGRIVCPAANKLRFGTLKLLIKAIVKNIRQSDACKSGIKYISRKIVDK